MTHLQKFAACRLAVMIIYLAAFFIMLPIFGLGQVFEYHWPVGLLFIGLLFIRPAKGDPAHDERDESIARQAWNRSSIIAGRFTLFIVAVSWIYVSYRGDDTIDHGELTQAQLSERVGVTRQTINALEAGKYVPSLELALNIARVFDQPVESVFQLADKE